MAMDSKANISVLSLSTRAHNCLRRSRRNTVGDLLNTTPSELRRIRNVGEATAREIELKISELGLALKAETGR